MRKIITLSFIIASFISNAVAQCSLNLPLYNKAKNAQEKNINTVIDILIQGNIDEIKQEVTSVGGKFKYAAGDIASVSMPLNKISEMVSKKGIERIEAFSAGIHPLNDTMLKNNNVLPVHNGQAPLTQGYDGTGVIAGFIDTGIDITHPDFQDSLGHSRIKFLWDQSLPNAANTPVTYGYGQEFSNTDIDGGLASASYDTLYVGHGTHTAGVGVSSGMAPGHFKGVAPKADIIMVGVDFYANHNIIVDGANYIFAKATQLGKPCVINISLGDNGVGSHDGTDLQAQLLNNMISTQQGRSIVVAAGNVGDWPFHLGYNVTTDTNFTFFSNSAGSIYIQLYGEVANLNTTKFSIGADQITPSHSFRGHTAYTTVASHTGVVDVDTVYNSGHRIGVMQMHAQIYTGPLGPTYFMEYLIVPDSTNYVWRLSATSTGSGKFDVWNYDVMGSGLPSLATMPDSAFYKMPDINQTICSSYQCLTNVVTVGGYVNRRTMMNYNSVLNNDFATVGQMLSYSSSGPTRDGRIKPDITSPGDFLVSAVVSSMVSSYYVAGGVSDEISQDAYHVAASGTSAASPSVAGIAALYLQKNPTATALQVKNAITACATQDQFTGTNLPNNSWGYGKANAFTTLTGCSTVGITNYNTISAGTLSVFPNPANEGSSINITVANFGAKDKMELKIYNAIGELVKTVNVTNSFLQVSNNLPAGVYFCTLEVNSKKAVTQKLVVL